MRDNKNPFLKNLNKLVIFPPPYEDAQKDLKPYLLRVPRATWRARIIRRFVKQKLGLEKGKKETLASLHALLKWADKFDSQNLPEIKKLLDPYREKVIE